MRFMDEEWKRKISDGLKRFHKSKGNSQERPRPSAKQAMVDVLNSPASGLRARSAVQTAKTDGGRRFNASIGKKADPKAAFGPTKGRSDYGAGSARAAVGGISAGTTKAVKDKRAKMSRLDKVKEAVGNAYDGAKKTYRRARKAAGEAYTSARSGAGKAYRSTRKAAGQAYSTARSGTHSVRDKVRSARGRSTKAARQAQRNK